MLCWCSTFDSDWIWLRTAAACSNLSCSAKPCIFVFEVGHHFGLAPAQEFAGVLDVDAVVLARDRRHARRAAAADLVQQAGPRAVRVDAVLAGAQHEHLLQDLHRLLHRPGARERPEVLALLVERTAVVGHARHVLAGDLQVGIRFIVAEQDVEARLERLDQVVFEDQRFGLAVRDRGLEPRDALDHHGDARAGQVLLEVARHALLQVARLADVQHRVVERRNSGTRPAGWAAWRRWPAPARADPASARQVRQERLRTFDYLVWLRRLA